VPFLFTGKSISARISVLPSWPASIVHPTASVRALSSHFLSRPTPALGEGANSTSSGHGKDLRTTARLSVSRCRLRGVERLVLLDAGLPLPQFLGGLALMAAEYRDQRDHPGVDAGHQPIGFLALVVARQQPAGAAGDSAMSASADPRSGRGRRAGRSQRFWRAGIRLLDGRGFRDSYSNRRSSRCSERRRRPNFRMDDDSIPLKLLLAAPLPADW
jgi:hypothetical protein